MIKEKRFEHILAKLKETATVMYHDISVDLQVSEDTVRRDIEYLHQNGLLSKVRGGAIATNKNPLTFQDRADHQSDEKDVIACKVQPMLKKGMTIFMDGGTTVCAVAERIPTDSSFRIITNNLALVPVLGRLRNVELIVLGGTYHRDTQTNIGAKTCEDAEQFIVDLYLMGTCAISPAFGVTAAIQEDGAVKKSMLKGAKKVIVLSDSRKIDTNEHFKVCELDRVDMLVTELASNDPLLDMLRFRDLKIV